MNLDTDTPRAGKYILLRGPLPPIHEIDLKLGLAWTTVNQNPQNLTPENDMSWLMNT
jgi:hypothetical protein